jgi:hypothetical protein
MQRLTRILLMFILTAGLSAYASTVWNPAANGITPPATGNWNEAANWTNGLPDPDGIVNDGKVQFNVEGAAECIVDAASPCGRLVVGDNGTENGNFLRIVNGGSLIPVIEDWNAVGYNRAATMTVEAGGYFETLRHLLFGFSGTGICYLNVDGGHVVIGTTIQVGDAGGIITVDHDGLLECANLTIANTAVSRVDVRYGTIIINGDRTGTLAAWEAMVPPVITAFGGSGVLAYDYNVTHSGKTTITASAGDAPTPDPATFAVVPTAISSSQITMAATEGSDVDGGIEYLFTETTTGAGSGWITSNTYTADALTENTTYTFTVTLRDAYGTQGAASDPVSATTWSATTTTIDWNPPVSAPSNWGTASNWTSSAAGRPDGNFICNFSRSGEPEAVVTSEHRFSTLRMNVNGAVVRIKNGGHLTTTGDWVGISYSNPTNRLIVEAGGRASFSNHLWIGFTGSSVGILDINGGTVDVVGQLGLGWNGGTGYLNITNGGVLNLNQIDGANSIKGISKLDIESGYVVINGNETADVANYVAAGKITAYGGTGRILYDYNATHPGKTTIQAIEGVEGDVNEDGGVDMKDLSLLAEDWLASDCDSPANFDLWCLVDLRDFTALAANWLGGIRTDWHVADTLFPTDDIIITPHYAENFGIVADGTTDVTDAIQTAMISIDNMGGGALFLPAGHYKVSGNLTVPSKVTLRGDWQQPHPGIPVAGTILQAYAGRGDENAAPFIELSGSAGLNGITIWYPEQLPGDIQPYPPTIHGGGVTLENVTLVNSYFGFTTYREGTTARPFVRNVYGTPLKTGIEYDRLADIGRIETVHFAPDYWAGCGLANAPTAGQHEAWIYNNGTGVIVRRIDWSYSCYVTVEGYSIGLALRPSRWSEDSGATPNGQSYGFNLINCKTGIYIEKSAYAGYQFTRFNIQGAQTGVYLGTASSEADMFHTCTINASGDAISSEGIAKVMMMSCDIQQGALDIDGGYLSVMNSSFASTGNHIELASGVRGATIQGNSFAGAARIVDNTAYPVEIDHTPVAADPLPPYDYKKPTTAYKAAKSDLYVVTEAPYGAAADGVTDDTTAFQAALADAGANGGGIVFVPGGNYRLNGNLTVPTGVELRGVFDVPHGTSEKGSLLNVYAGRNNADGTPFIQLESGAGIRGLNFHYPEQIYDELDPVNYGMVPYPFLIRGLGSDVYAINLAATIPYQLLDLATYRCDRHYIDYIYSTALKTGIHVGNGSTDGQIHNCQFNPSAYTHQGLYYDSIPLGTSDNIHQILWRDATPYLFGNTVGQVLHENFVFGGAKGLHLAQEDGFGPSGYCMGFGVDACTTAFHIDDVGSGGLDPINSQIVSTNLSEGHYLETGASFTKTLSMFSSAGWGGHQYSAVINGGNVKLQLFHLARDGESGAFQVLNNAGLQNLGGNLRDYLQLGRPFLTIDAGATAEFVGNVINTPASQMPTNTANITSRGNLRVQ